MIRKNETRYCFSVLFYRVGDGTSGFTDGRKCGDVPPRKAFNFLILNPKRKGGGGNGFFPSVAIFSAQNVGFSEQIPPVE